MKNSRQIVFLLLAVFSVSCTLEKPQPAHIAVVVDRSGSTQGFERSALGVIQQGIGLPDIRRKSRVIILGTGDRETALEPLVLGSFEIPVARRVLEGLHQDDIHAEFMSVIQSVLHGQFDETADNTPLYLAVRRGLEALRGQGCGSEEYLQNSTECTIYIISDGEETAEKRIRTALNGTGDIRLEDMALDNAGVRVRWCGFANTNDNTEMRSAVRAERLEEVWKALFTHSELVIMEPFCPVYNGGEQ